MTPANVTAFGSLAVMVMSPLPSNATPFIFLEVANLVAVSAFPDKLALITPAAKFPDPSLATILFAVFVVATSKEIYDKFSGKGTPDIMDIVWTMFGAITIFIATTFS